VIPMTNRVRAMCVLSETIVSPSCPMSLVQAGQDEMEKVCRDSGLVLSGYLTRSVRAVRDSLSRGRVTIVLGSTGVGKTTTLNVVEMLEPSLSLDRVYVETCDSFRDILSLCGRKNVVTVLDGNMSSSQMACLTDYAHEYNNLFVLESCDMSELSPAALSTCCLVNVSHKDTNVEEKVLCDRVLSAISTISSLPEKSVRNSTAIASLLTRWFEDCFNRDIITKRHATTSLVSCISACLEQRTVTLESLEATVIFCSLHVGIALSFTTRSGYKETQDRICEVICSALQRCKDPLVTLPDELSKYYFDLETKTWLSWDRLLPVALEQHFDENLTDMVVPVCCYDLSFSLSLSLETFISTPKHQVRSTVRVSYLTSKLLRKQVHIALIGDSGTGKTALSNHMLRRYGTKLLDAKDKLVCCDSSMEDSKTFCKYASAQMYAHGKNRFGAAPDKQCVVFVDDVHLASRGVKTLLRELAETQRWRQVGKLVGTSAFVSTQSFENPRMLRHFVPVALSRPNESDLLTICYGYLAFAFRESNSSFKRLTAPLACVLRDVYIAVSKSSSTLSMRNIASLAVGMRTLCKETTRLVRRNDLDSSLLSLDLRRLSCEDTILKEANERDSENGRKKKRTKTRSRRRRSSLGFTRSLTAKKEDEPSSPKEKKTLSEKKIALLRSLRLFAHEAESSLFDEIEDESKRASVRVTMRSAIKSMFNIRLNSELSHLDETCDEYTRADAMSLPLIQRLHYLVSLNRQSGTLFYSLLA